jgi:superfamily II DNA helicase RecQ
MQLIALAKDQVEKCDECSIEAELWNSSVPAAKLEMLTQELCTEEPTLKLLYTTPGDEHWLLTAHSTYIVRALQPWQEDDML